MFGNRKKAIGGAEKLAGVAFFDGFSPDELQRVAELADDVDAEPGAVLVEQGRVGQECYVILEGQAGVYVGGEHVATSGPGLDGRRDGAPRAQAPQRHRGGRDVR